MLITVGIPMNEPHQNVATASRADGTELPLPEIQKTTDSYPDIHTRHCKDITNVMIQE